MGNEVPQNTFGIVETEYITDLILGDSGTGTENPAEVTPIAETPDTKKKAPKGAKPEEAAKETATLSQEQSEEVITSLLLNEEDAEESETEEGEESQEQTENIDTSTGTNFSSLAKDLSDLGIFTETEGEEEAEITTPEQFAERWNKEKQKAKWQGIYDIISNTHGELGAEAFQAIFVDGVKPQDYISQFLELESVKGLDLSTEDNQEKIVKEYYTRLGWKKERIDKKIENLKNTADLEDEASVVHEKLVEQEEEELQEMQEQAKIEQQQKLKMKQQTTQSFNNILSAKLKAKDFDGIPVTDKVARETFDMLTTEKWKLPSGELLTDFDKMILDLRKPENHETKVKIALLAHNNWDFSKIKTKAISQKNEQLFNNLTRSEKTVKKTQKTFPASGSFFDTSK